MRHAFLFMSEFLMQNHFLMIIFYLFLFESGVINPIRKTVACFLMFEVVATFSVEKVYFGSKVKIFWPALSCSSPAGSSYLSTQKWVCIVCMAYFYFLKGRKNVMLLTVLQIVIKFKIYSDDSCACLTS